MTDAAAEHSTLVAKVTEYLKIAEAATPGPWMHVDFADPSGQPMTNYGGESTYMGCGSVITMGTGVAGGDIAAPNGDLYPRSGYSPAEDMAHIAAHDPSWAIRVHRQALETLNRHAPDQSQRCRYCTEPGHSVQFYPCPEVVGVRAIYLPEASDG